MTNYYACQIKVPRVGAEGQAVLSGARCLVVGMGGLGCPSALYLAGSGIGRLGLCDYDQVELGNISRQILYHPGEIGQDKLAVASAKLRSQNPYIELVCHNTRLCEANWQDILAEYELILDCTDNFPSKYLIHDACLALGKDLIQGGIFQTSGQVYYFPFSQKGSSAIACLRCVWPEIPAPDMQRDCSEAGVMTALAGTVALRQVNTALLSLLGLRDKGCSEMALLDWERLEWSTIDLPLAAACSCQTAQQRNRAPAYLYRAPLECTELPAASERNAVILDVRNPEHQGDNAKFGGRPVQRLSREELCDFGHFIQRTQADKADKSYVLVCYKGIRSLALARLLRDSGYRAASYSGGYARLEALKNSDSSSDA